MDIVNGMGIDYGTARWTGWRGAKEEKNGTTITA